MLRKVGERNPIIAAIYDVPYTRFIYFMDVSANVIKLKTRLHKEFVKNLLKNMLDNQIKLPMLPSSI